MSSIRRTGENMNKKTTKKFNELVEQIKKSGFYVDTYSIEKDNVERYKRDLIREHNTYNIDLRQSYINGSTFEEVEKSVLNYFKDAKQKRTKQLIRSWVNIPDTFRNSDKFGYNDGLKLSFDELKKEINEHLKTPRTTTIKKKLYFESWNRERIITETQEDFKQFVELCLKCDYDEKSFIYTEFNQHVTFKLVSEDYKKAYLKLLKEDILNYFSKVIYFNIADLPKVLKLSSEQRFILCYDVDKKQNVFYLYVKSNCWDKIKSFSIDTPTNKEINAELRLNEVKGLDEFRFKKIEDLYSYCSRSEKDILTDEAKRVLKLVRGGLNE